MDNLERIFKKEFDNHTIGDAEVLWNKFNKTANSKNSFFYKSQLIAVLVLALIALPFTMNDNNIINTTPTQSLKNTEVVLEEINLDIIEMDENSEVLITNTKEDISKAINFKSVNQIQQKQVQELELEMKFVENIELIELVNKVELNTKESTSKFSLGINISADELLAQIEEENQKGPAELFASKLIKKISKSSRDYISYTKIDN